MGARATSTGSSTRSPRPEEPAETNDSGFLRQEVLRMPFIETNDGTILFYKDWGEGKPVLFVHGWCLGADMWEYQIPRLVDDGLRCIAYDVRGCGRSDQPGQGYDFDTLADDLAVVIEHLGLRDVTLVGHSMGSGQILRYLSRHGGGRVAQVALVSMIPPFSPRRRTTRTEWTTLPWAR